MFKRLILIIGILVSVAACHHRQPAYVPLPETSNIVILGDSLTYGTGAAEGQGYASRLASSTGWNVINAGVPGNTSSDALARLPQLLADHESGAQKIDFLIIELGGNDFLKHVPETETVSNLKEILAQAKARHIQAALLAIPNFSLMGAAFGSLSDHPLYAQLAKETDTPLIKDVFTEVLAKNSLKSDQIHPNAEGYRLVESKLRDALAELGFLRAK